MRIANADGAVPSNGGVLIVGESIEPAVLVTASDGAVVSGTLVDRGAASGPGEHYWVWIASVPPAPGAYSFEITSRLVGTVTTAVTFGETWSPTPPQLTSDPLPLEPWSMVFNAFCREGIGSDPTQPVGFDVDLRLFAISPNASTTEPTEPIEHVGQYLFRTRPTVSTEVTVPFALEPLATLRAAQYAENADEYCFVIEALAIVSGLTTIYSGEHCLSSAEAGEVGALGFDYQSDDLALLTLPQCAAPPMWHEKAWCSVNETACAQASAPAPCAIYCEDAAIAQPEDGGVIDEPPATTGMSSEQPAAGSGSLAAPENDQVEAPTHASGGCQLALSDRAPSVAPGLLMLATVGLYRARRRVLQRSVKPS